MNTQFSFLVMRVISLLALVCILAGVSHAESEPYSGSGDDDSDVVVITPTTVGRSQTDSPSDFGSGIDDEDDEDYTSSGSGVHSTTETPTTERETTTKKQETTTEATTTTKQYVTTTDDEDKDEYSGDDYSGMSGSGTTLPPTTRDGGNDWEPKSPSNTDLYTEATSTTDNTLIIEKMTTPEYTSSSIELKTDSTTVPKAATTVKKMTTTPSQFRTQKTTVKVTSKWIESTTESAKTTLKPEVTTEDNIVNIKSGKRPKPSTRQPGDNSPSKPQVRTTKVVHTLKETTKPTESGPGVMANKGKKKEGFTLTTEVIAGVVGCALLALLLIAFLMYRLKKRDEGSYLLDESNVYHDDYKKVYGSDKEAFI